MTSLKASLQPRGYLLFVLHAHLPFVRHPEVSYMMEENWLYEAITETYLPLLSMLGDLQNDKIPARMTLSITPTLCAMLSDNLLKERYRKHLSKLIKLSEKEVLRTSTQNDYHPIAKMYLDKFTEMEFLFDRLLDGDLLKGFRKFQDSGYLEIITCGATHGFLPTMRHNLNAVKAQIAVAIESHTSFFNHFPSGIWLPECGYYPGLEKELERNGIRYFFMETHGLLSADPSPQHGIYAPVYCKESTVAAFGRDPESSRAVWSAEEGYPGHPTYRDFYRDIGFDLDMDYIAPYIDPIGIRISTGIKYYKITGTNCKKLPYNRLAALRTASEHAGNFMFNRERQMEYLSSIMDRPPVVVAPYDAELFGHWWYEGPQWLNFLIRKIAFDQLTISMATPSDYLDSFPENQICSPAFSSWGEGGYSEVWIHKSNDWIYRHLHNMERLMVESASKYSAAEGIEKCCLNQMARELLLAESSDWAFIMKKGTTVNYAVRRTKEHIANFTRLYNDLEKNHLDPDFIQLLEAHNNIFPDIDYSIYAYND